MKQLLLIIALIAGSAYLASYLIKTKPEPRKRVRKPSVPVVEVMTPKLQSYTQKIRSAGSVETNLNTNLLAEVSGKIVSVSQTFQEGKYFKKGQHLLTIDPTDYKNAIIIARAEISQRTLEIKNEQNLARLALRDFQLLGNNRRPGEIASRKPHLAVAMANLEAAKVRLQQARDNLKKTKVVAPYTGRLQSMSVSIGQFVSTGTLLGQVYSTDYVEVRLPLSLADYEQLKLPENYQNQRATDKTQLPKVTFSANYGAKTHHWEGRIVRASAAMDTQTRQISVIARINAPFNKKAGNDTPPLKIGQFIQAEILGTQLNDVFVIPTASTRQNREVMLYNEGTISILPIDVLTSENDSLIIKQSALPPNAKLIITPMPSAKTGMKVRLPGKSKRETGGKSRRQSNNERKKEFTPSKNNNVVPIRKAQQEAPKAEIIDEPGDSDTILLSTQQRARLIAFVEGHPSMPDKRKSRLLKQLSKRDVAKRLIERLRLQIIDKKTQTETSQESN